MNPYIALQSILGLIALWFFIVYGWRNLRLDSFRNDVFEIRDEMFLYAAQGNVRFDHPAYTMLRSRMNVVLRYAHEFTLTKVCVVLLTQDLTNKPFAGWQSEVDTLAPEIQEKMREFNRRVAEAMLCHMIYSPFLLYLLVRPFRTLFKSLVVQEAAGERSNVVLTVERLEADAMGKDARYWQQATAAA
jgi:hypothetical protein